ncbi:spore coat associated protein CotJA [Heyndrickxia acidiproducens]|uniref:spore coat associated protein CotJA n=1 Tax=Heyndrickxia acidiproducens TaxID=1121084 RepID=UPI0003653D6C|nr:spore coat associated protein CotJA [Heyndrickxia acidiproducens]
MNTPFKTYYPFISPFDPCPPMKEKVYSTPPNVYMGFQPPNLPQFPPKEALARGTLWLPLYDPYYSPYERAKE